MHRLEPASSVLLIVDVQERLSAAMPAETMDLAVANMRILLEAARILAVPVIATEQYSKGLGPTVAPLAEPIRERGVQAIEKLTFSACDEPRVDQALSALSPRSAVVAGVETHVCVFQTARDLVARGLEVYVVVDAVASRREENRLAGLSLAERAGALLAPTETVVFDWLRRAGTDEFKAVSKLVR
jgi:nicotinamidase-related amidase